ncbi:MAG: ATP-binding protein [Trichlorobacter sp.]|uniref:ATP-binding protein n=1 Tax=Trichlorobacter sp. TaxID=2911007 RepID=UPI00256CA817|nr:ATP-binding protein [Trichlorobacter sp.]MDK9719298.1 ATP-binding protein [Trichlorobacter sp.]
MKSLFVKLFIAFLLAMLISGAVFFSFAFRIRGWLLEQRYPEITQQQHDRQLHPGFHPKEPPPGRDLLLPPPMLVVTGIQALIFLLVGAGICYLLAWRMSEPVHRLRQTVQQLAGGDLSARTGIAEGDGGDEINDLGRDFDRMAERIESLLTSQKQLVRDISHELRSPLARLQVALGLARRKATSDVEPALDRIEQEAERLNTMIGELLTLSLLDSGTALDSAEPIDLGELLDQVVQDAAFEAAAGDRQVVLSAETDSQVSGNWELLRRAVENVVRNALRYTSEHAAVEVLLKQEHDCFAIIRVMDHGPGVPEIMLDEIFKPFSRVDEARDRQSGGAGIGLAITARAVALHGGCVTASNRSGGGLAVEIRLPLYAKQPDSPAVRPLVLKKS